MTGLDGKGWGFASFPVTAQRRAGGARAGRLACLQCVMGARCDARMYTHMCALSGMLHAML